MLGAGAMERLRKLVERVARSDISVVLLGETGSGKSALASELHQRSNRAAGPFVGFNCAAMSESLLESELFGHEKGAFTGAVGARQGLFEAAQGGTVFLDEIGELPLGLQAKLLEVLEERAVRRVGSTRKFPIDVRVLCATNRDLELAVAQGRFRADLWFRLDGIALVVPPLRERVDEIPGLARAFVARAALGAGRSAPELSAEALALLARHPWPGNVRELRNAVERALLLCGDRPIAPEHLPQVRGSVYALPTAPIPRASAPAGPAAPIAEPPAAPVLGPPGVTPAAAPAGPPLDARAAERARIAEALAQCGGNQGRAARLLGISRRTLVTRLSQHDLPRPRKR